MGKNSFDESAWNDKAQARFKESTYPVVKSNILIQKSRFNLSATEQKIILYMVSKIKRYDSELNEFVFSIPDFCNICGIDYTNGGNYARLKKTIKSLADKSVWITDVETKTETLLRWIERPYIEHQSGTIRIKFDELMTPYLLSLNDNFTIFSLINALPMKSKYSIRLYELLKSYQNQSVVTLTVEQLKTFLIPDANSKNKLYDRFADFNRKVLTVALKEINAYTDLVVDTERISKGKTTIALRFSMKLKDPLDYYETEHNNFSLLGLNL